MDIKKIDIHSDSQLVVNKLLGTYQPRESKMTSYLAYMKALQSIFEEFNITQVPRFENIHADALANLGSFVPTTESQTITLVYLQWPIVWKDPLAEVTTIDVFDTWMNLIIRYLINDELPFDKNAA